MAADQMEQIPLGRTGLMISKVGFGTSALGSMPDTYGYDVGEERAQETIRAILSSPAHYLDTSRSYGFGRSEERIGSVIRDRGGLPQGFLISTSSTAIWRPIGSTRRRPVARSRRALPPSALIGSTSSTCMILNTPRLSRMSWARMARLPSCSACGRRGLREQSALPLVGLTS